MKLLLRACLFSIPVFFSLAAASQERVLSPEKMQALVPHHIEGYEDNDVKGKLMEVGNIQYSLCEYKFTSGKQTVRVLLFDYHDAPIMYKQATKVWQNYTPIITDSATLRPLWLTNCSGWESYRKRSNSSQIYLGICDRFFLTLTGEGVDLQALKQILGKFNFEQFPK